MADLQQERKDSMFCMAVLICNMFDVFNEAGGVPPSMEELQRMSALDFLYKLAPNNIKLYYTRPISEIPPQPVVTRFHESMGTEPFPDDIPF